MVTYISMRKKRIHKEYVNEWDDIGWKFLKENDPYIRIMHVKVSELEYPYLSIHQMERRKRHEILVEKVRKDN